MKIVWLNHRDVMHPRGGGAERSILEIGKRLVLRGHQVTLVTAGYSGGLGRQTVEGIDVRRFGRSLAPHFASYGVIHQVSPDVVVHDLAHVVPWGNSLITRIPNVVFFHHLHARTLGGQVTPPASALLKGVEARYSTLYSRSQWVTESNSSSGDLTRLGIPSEHIHRIPPGVDTELFRPRIRSAQPSLIYFGGFREYKRPGMVVDLVRYLNRNGEGLTAEVVGDGPVLGAVKSKVRQDPSTASLIRFHGRVSYPELSALVSKAWVNVHSAVAEGWCFSAMEASAAGTPTVGFRIPGLTESVVEGVSGYLVPDGDIEHLAEATRRVIREFSNLSAGARRIAMTFSWDATTLGWEKVLEATAS